MQHKQCMQVILRSLTSVSALGAIVGLKIVSILPWRAVAALLGWVAPIPLLMWVPTVSPTLLPIRLGG